jgi:branched-chain amino acid transport system ATP-binding protein
MTPLLEVRALQAGYGRRMVLHGIDLTMAAGEGLALIGHNGTGKSTLIKAICGVLRTGAGSVLLDGIDVTGLPPEAMVKRGVVHVPAGRRLFPAMTVRHNLEAGAFVRRDAAGIRADIEAMLHRFPTLSDKADRMAGLLSGGEQQALALARGLMARPRLMLVDEPSLGLSPALVRQVREVIASLRADGVAVMLAEQNLRMALAATDHALLLSQGRVVLSGTSATLLDSAEIRQGYLGVSAA